MPYLAHNIMLKYNYISFNTMLKSYTLTYTQMFKSNTLTYVKMPPILLLLSKIQSFTPQTSQNAQMLIKYVHQNTQPYILNYTKIQKSLPLHMPKGSIINQWNKHMDTHLTVLSWGYPMKTNITGFRCFGRLICSVISFENDTFFLVVLLL